jgi:hypothetical protein
MRMKRIVLISVLLALAAVVPVVFAPPPTPRCPSKVTGGGQIGFVVCRDYHRANFGFNIQCHRCELKGELQYIDHLTGMKIHIHDILSLTFTYLGSGDWCAQFSGIDVYSGEVIRVHVHDNGEPGRADLFEIWGPGGYHGIGDPILHGNIQVH